MPAAVYHEVARIVSLRQQDVAPGKGTIVIAAAGTDKTRLLSAQVFLSDMNTKARFDAVWNPWIGPHPAHWPQRACVGATLAGTCQVEIILLAAAAT